MKSSPLAYLVYVFIEIIWLTPFLAVSAILAYAQNGSGSERRLESRLKAANVFLLTAVAARLVAVTLEHNAAGGLPSLDIVAVMVALSLAFLLQLVGRVASEYELDIGAKAGRFLAVLAALMLSMVLLALASPWLDYLKLLRPLEKSASGGLPINYKVKPDEEWLFKDESLTGRAAADIDAELGRKWIFSLTDQEDVRPLTAKELARAKNLFAQMGLVYVPKKPYQRKKIVVRPERTPVILEYPDVVPADLLPKSDEGMVVTDISPVNKNMITARITPHLAANSARLSGTLAITALYDSQAAERFFGRQFDSRNIYIGGERATVSSSPGKLIARWTKRRFAFEVQAEWSDRIDGRTPVEFLQHIIRATAAATAQSVD